MLNSSGCVQRCSNRRSGLLTLGEAATKEHSSLHEGTLLRASSCWPRKTSTRAEATGFERSRSPTPAGRRGQEIGEAGRHLSPEVPGMNGIQIRTFKQ